MSSPPTARGDGRTPSSTPDASTDDPTDDQRPDQGPSEPGTVSFEPGRDSFEPGTISFEPGRDSFEHGGGSLELPDTAIVTPVRITSFWVAIVLPVLHVPLLASGLSTRFEATAFVLLVATNLLALYVGRSHRR